MNDSIMVISVVSWYAVAILILRILVEKTSFGKVAEGYETEERKVGDVEESFVFLTWLLSPIAVVIVVASSVLSLVEIMTGACRRAVVKLIVGKRK